MDLATCESTPTEGVIGYSISGGTQPYDLYLYVENTTLSTVTLDRTVFNITGTGSPSIASGIFRSLLPLARYRVEVVDDTGVCTDIENAFLTVGLTFDWDAIADTIVNDTCLESPSDIGDGSITITSAQVSNLITGGSGSYIYSWEGQTSQGTQTFTGPDISGLLPGAYTVTILDQIYLCDVTRTFNVSGPPALDVTVDPILTSPREQSWYPKPVLGSSSGSGTTSGTTTTVSGSTSIDELIYLDCVGDLADLAIQVTGAASQRLHLYQQILFILLNGLPMEVQ